MVNHPKRQGAPRPFCPPTAAELRQLIDDAAITQAQAAELCHAGLRTMQQWLSGARAMPMAPAELLSLKTGRRWPRPSSVSRLPSARAWCARPDTCNR